VTTERTEFKRASDALFKWALGLVGLGLVAAIGLLLDIRFQLGVYQADAKAMKDRLDKVEAWELRHDQEDRARFQALAREPK